MKPPALLMLLVLLQAGAGAQVRRDPFARPASAVPAAAAVPLADQAAIPPAPPAPPRLRAVMYEPGKSLVNINGRILALGEYFEDYRVADIQPGSATLIRRGVRSVLVLAQESSK